MYLASFGMRSLSLPVVILSVHLLLSNQTAVVGMNCGSLKLLLTHTRTLAMVLPT